MRRAGTALTLLLVAAIVAWTSSCAAEPGDEETQPAPDQSVFAAGDFDRVPLVPTAEQIGPRSETDGVVSASWGVRDRTAEGVLEWYRVELPDDGWQARSGPQPIGDGIWRGEWIRDGRLLEVVAQEVDTLGDGEVTYPTQLSLLLHPDQTAPPVAPPGT